MSARRTSQPDVNRPMSQLVLTTIVIVRSTSIKKEIDRPTPRQLDSRLDSHRANREPPNFQGRAVFGPLLSKSGEKFLRRWVGGARADKYVCDTQRRLDSIQLLVRPTDSPVYRH